MLNWGTLLLMKGVVREDFVGGVVFYVTCYITMNVGKWVVEGSIYYGFLHKKQQKTLQMQYLTIEGLKQGEFYEFNL